MLVKVAAAAVPVPIALGAAQLARALSSVPLVIWLAECVWVVSDNVRTVPASSSNCTAGVVLTYNCAKPDGGVVGDEACSLSRIPVMLSEDAMFTLATVIVLRQVRLTAVGCKCLEQCPVRQAPEGVP